MNKPEKSYELSKWANIVRNKCLTIKDIKSMEVGEKIIFLSLHRNFIEELEIEEKKIYTPIEFFKNVMRVEYTHIGGIYGTWTMYNENDVYFKNEKLEFHIEYEYEKWYPLEKGILPKKILMPNWKTGMMDEIVIKKQKWQEYDELTLLGYRGELIKEEFLKDLPKIYYEENSEDWF